MKYMTRFSNTKPTLNSWDELQLVVVYFYHYIDGLNLLMLSKGFCSYVHEGYEYTVSF